MGFSVRIAARPAASRAFTVLLARNLYDASGKLAWYFVRVATSKLSAFERQLAQGKVDMTMFGEVLSSGYGDSPPAHVTERMCKIYGYQG
jgi:hypothetical protein